MIPLKNQNFGTNRKVAKPNKWSTASGSASRGFDSTCIDNCKPLIFIHIKRKKIKINGAYNFI